MFKNKYVRVKPKPPHIWEKGQSGNPDGRPKKVAEVAAMAGAMTPLVFETLHDMLKDKKTTPHVRVAIAGMFLDRAYGRAPQSVTIKGDSENPIPVANLSPEQYEAILRAAKEVEDSV